MKIKSKSIYGIRHKQTKEPWETPNGKWAWQGVGQAKNAFLAHNYPRHRAGCFNLSDFEYEVVFLGELKWAPVNSEDSHG